MNRCFVVVGVASLMLASSSQFLEAHDELNQPINCATAQGDIRVLESEKAHVLERAAKGVTAILPAGAVLGIVTGTEDDKLEVASGDYNEKIDRKISEIKTACGL